MTRRNNKHQKGFTIIELMIATTIFSLVLMICLAAIMSITRMYYQGTLQARTQNAVRELVDEVADEIRYRPGDFITAGGPAEIAGDIELEDGTPGLIDPRSPLNQVGQYCIGNIRYRYLLGFKTDIDASYANSPDEDRSAARPLLRDVTTSDCGDNDDIDEQDEIIDEFIVADQSNGVLDENMRIVEFDVSRVGSSDNYLVAVAIAYGDDDLLGYENGQHTCRPNNVARAYCATARLEVTVSRRIQND